ncbi:Probable LRR receptor-like serine/threonine-protein kinase At3g47570 [Linum grandiflorum]
MMGFGSLSVQIGVTKSLLLHMLCFCCCVCSGLMTSNETDRAALLQFKSMISADPLGALSSWNDSTHFCKWHGVSCSRRHYGRVTVLNLPSQKLYGSVSPQIGNLSFLRVLSLYNNNFIQEIPPEIGRLHRLQQLRLNNNSFGGEIPSNISGCSSLAVFDVSSNKIAGGLPWQFGLLTKLQYFLVTSNNLTGSIPHSFGNLSYLQQFSLVRNRLSGTVPDSLGQLSSLQVLALDTNHLHGEIHPSIFNISTLTDLWLGWNRFHGNLPSDLGISLPNLEFFNVGYNQFTGSVPPSFSNASNIVLLQLHYNNFTGSMPSMGCSNKLTRFVVEQNSLGSETANDLDFLSSLTNATTLEYIAAGYNHFGGNLPQNIGNLSTSMKVLILNDNKISGYIPSEIQYLVNLEDIWICNNNLSGTIPSSIGNLLSLERLFLYNNNISGYVPSSIGNLTKLLDLDISDNRLQGEFPASIQNCKKLLALDLSGNNFSGGIPLQVMNLTSLSRYLFLSRNQFNGSIPLEVGNLRNLGALDLSDNMLSGSIPSSLGSCVSLELLYLGGNLLRGGIPTSLSSLRGIEELDLSFNHLEGIVPSSLSSFRAIQGWDLSVNNLSGEIPKFLEHLNTLQLLNLSYNNFEGEVSEEGIFRNSSIIFVQGNTKLCGGMAELKLLPCHNLRHRNKALNHKWRIVISTISSLLFLTSICSCLFIFWIKKRGKKDTVPSNDLRSSQLSYQRLYKATDGFSSTNLIGIGSFGSVYKGALDENGTCTNIAVKVFNLERHGASKSFMAECEALKNIKHRNLVRIITVCSSVDHEGKDFKALIYEFLANGSLEEWLHCSVERIEEPTRSLNFIQRVNLAIDIASGVDYLHNNCGTPIVHCDLKPSNILLDEDMVAHIGDFGLARFISKATVNPSSSSIGIKGTVGYAPPEYGMGNEVSMQGDMYSYGVVLLEMFTGRRPIDETFREGLNLHNIVKSALLRQCTCEVVDRVLLDELLRRGATNRNYASTSSEGTRKDLKELLTSVLEIAIACSSDIPEERISMNEVLSRLTASSFNFLHSPASNYQSTKMGSGNMSVNVVVAAALFQLLCFCSCYGSNETDRLALLSFKSMITNDPLGALSSWNDSNHFCRWYGVSCSKRHYGQVSALRLQNQELSGSISPHVGNLSFLKVLNLSNNMFVGEIPHEIGRLGRLQKFSLHNNSLGGEIPPNISGCSALIVFSVAENKLVGGLPWQLGQLNKLRVFSARYNNLSGSIPASFGNLSSLQVFAVGHYNQMSGRLPDALGQLQSLHYLYMGQNSLSGEIPASIFNISSLVKMSFGDNQLNGSLPWNLGISLPNLEVLDVYGNYFTGSLPPSLSNASNLVFLQLNINNFTGSVPTMKSSNKLRSYVIYSNSLGSGKAGDLDFLSSLTNATGLEVLHIGVNNFGGSLPKHIANLSTSLKYLAFCENKISGNIPSEIQQLVNLEEIVAYTNLLSGTIPQSIGNLRSLKHLYLDNNHLSGYIPSSIGNLTQLIEVSMSNNHLQGQLPESIGNCREIIMLDLAFNNLSGAIPSQVFSLASLSRNLLLANNKFSGSIPLEVGSLKNLGSFDLSYNILSGNIPSSLGSCASLEFLQLQGNLLQGTVPESLSSLRGLRVLDLSSNNLTGQIPIFLEHMDIWQSLNLSYNNFEGEVPDQGVFRNTSIISVIGNNKLCGGIDELKFRPCYYPKQSKKMFNHKWKVVISTISGVGILALITSCLFIFLKRGKQVSVSANALQLPLPYQRLYKATNGFSSANLIGVGSFGSVYKGVLSENGTNTDIAVKVFNLQRHGASKSFIAECEALKNIRHRNLVRIITVCSSVDHEGKEFKALVYEFLANGSLEEWLHRSRDQIDEPTTRLNFSQRVNLAIDIASGVDYLHTNCGTPIVHCDLKPSNILLDEDMVAHIGDFGLARILSEHADPTSSSIFIKGTVGYAAPEYGMGNEVSLQGDVYSYGILILEMFTGQRPVDESFKEGLNLHNIVQSALSNQQTMKVVDPILRNELLRRATTHRSRPSSSSEEAKKV